MSHRIHTIHKAADFREKALFLSKGITAYFDVFRVKIRAATWLYVIENSKHKNIGVNFMCSRSKQSNIRTNQTKIKFCTAVNVYPCYFNDHR